MNSNTIDKSNDIKQLREQIRKLDERLDCEMQVLYSTVNIRLCQTSCVQMRDFCMFVFEQELAREEQGWAEEMESVENHRKLLEKKVNHGYDEAVQQLKAAQQQWVTVVKCMYPSVFCSSWMVWFMWSCSPQAPPGAAGDQWGEANSGQQPGICIHHRSQPRVNFRGKFIITS